MQNLPIKLYNSNQIKELEGIAVHEYGISGFELMSRAGGQVFQCLQQHYPAANAIAVFCGAGNNAGDGYVLARLALEANLSVCVYTLSDPANLKGDALVAYQNYRRADGQMLFYQERLEIKADVIVDALLGTGLARNLAGNYASAVHAINDSPAQVIAVDIPSGLNADTGDVMGDAVMANCTVTFIGLKQGLFTGQAVDYCGEIVYSSLAIPEQIFTHITASSYRVVHRPLPPRKRYSHKGDFGHVLIVGGEQGFSGAIKLAGEAALRVGAGLVTIATRPSHAATINLNRPELMCHGVENVAQLNVLLANAKIIVIGPGLGQSYWAEELFFAVIHTGKPVVIDADALNILARSPAAINRLSLRPSRSILTPHVGEAQRLLFWSKDEIKQDRFAAVAAIQHKYGGIAILKGAGTLIADGQTIAVATTGNPGMATGGMGDVLSGVIGGLLAQGLSLEDAARQGVCIHGLAADLSAQEYGERGLLAKDLMPYLRKLVNP